MGTKYTKLALEERCTLSRLHEDGKAIREIAAVMGRAASTISRELRRNRAEKQAYKPVYADEQAWARRWRGSRMERQPELREAVLNKLAMGWSPEQVAARLAQGQPSMRISPESIYRFIYAQIRRTNDFSWRKYLPCAKFRRGYRGRKGGGGPVSSIKNRVSIAKRPSCVERRRQPGHWESDILMFGNKKDNVLVAQERTSRFIFLAGQPDRTADRVARNLLRCFKELPAGLRRSLTQDNGTEFAQHFRLNEKLGMRTFFCNPHSPWQKGGVENMNGRLRRYLPVTTDPKSLTRHSLKAIADRINNTPRKCLGFKTPAEVFSAQLLHFECESTFPLSRE